MEGFRRWSAASLALLLCALVLYGVAPAVLGVLDAWPRVADIEPYWFAAMIAAQVRQLGRVLAAAAALGRRPLVVADHHVAARLRARSAASCRAAGGGGALQYRMLVQAGISPSLAGIGIGAATIVMLATLCALPLLALPPIILGSRCPTRLAQAALVGSR